jgi:AcrR family transcriptional regulator
VTTKAAAERGAPERGAPPERGSAATPGAGPAPVAAAAFGGERSRLAEQFAALHSYLTDRGETPAGLRERKKLATRNALGVAAMRLAIERGLDNFLVEDIAEEAGVSARTFNNYFGSKYEAICALGFDRAMRVGAALRERPAEEPLWEAIIQAVMSEYGTADRALDEQWMAGIRLVVGTPVLRGEYLKVQSMIQYSLAEAIALRSEFSPAASMFPRILAASVTAAVQGAMDRWVHSDPPAALAPLMRAALDQLADGMRQVLGPQGQPPAARSG